MADGDPRFQTKRREIGADGELAWGGDGESWRDAVSESSGVSVSNQDGIEPEIIVPDSAVAHFNVQNLIGYSDGDTVSTWPNKVGADATGQATYRVNGINGYASIEFDGISDEFAADVGVYSQVNTIIAVVELAGSDNHTIVAERDGAATDRNNLQYTTGKWNMFAGKSIYGSEEPTRQLITSVVDGANTVIREDGRQTVSGDAGTEGLNGVRIGYMEEIGGRYWDGEIGLVEIHDGLPSNGLQTRENEIATEWGISTA